MRSYVFKLRPDQFTSALFLVVWTLGWEDERGELSTARLMRWGTATEAKDFAAWLQEQLPASITRTAIV